MTQVLAIGPYDDADRAALAQMGAAFVDSVAALTPMPGVRAVAYKGHAPFDGTVMDKLPDLGLIANFGVGYDAIDADEATRRDIRVTNTPDVLSDDVADLAVALALGQARGLVPAAAHAAGGGWAAGKPLPLGRKLTGLRVGILGLGRIGREIADRFAAFKMPVHYWSRSPKDVPDGWTCHPDPVGLAASSDVLVIALVGGDETRSMVDAQVLAALPDRAIVVNISRGTTVDEAALLDQLDRGRITAALDVALNEPQVDPRLLNRPDVLMLPHIGSATRETRAEMAALQRRNVQAFLDGTALPTPVN